MQNQLPCADVIIVPVKNIAPLDIVAGKCNALILWHAEEHVCRPHFRVDSYYASLYAFILHFEKPHYNGFNLIRQS